MQLDRASVPASRARACAGGDIHRRATGCARPRAPDPPARSTTVCACSSSGSTSTTSPCRCSTRGGRPHTRSGRSTRYWCGWRAAGSPAGARRRRSPTRRSARSGPMGRSACCATGWRRPCSGATSRAARGSSACCARSRATRLRRPASTWPGGISTASWPARRCTSWWRQRAAARRRRASRWAPTSVCRTRSTTSSG